MPKSRHITGRGRKLRPHRTFGPASILVEKNRLVPEPVAVVPAAEPLAAPEPVSVAEAVPLHLLDLSIGKLTAALATGEHDAHLAALLEAEGDAQDRKGAKAAIQERMG